MSVSTLVGDTGCGEGECERCVWLARGDTVRYMAVLGGFDARRLDDWLSLRVTPAMWRLTSSILSEPPL